MEVPAKPEFAFIDGKQIKITYCPPARGIRDLDLRFDRYQFDNARLSPEMTRSQVLINKEFGLRLTADGHRKAPKRTE